MKSKIHVSNTTIAHSTIRFSSILTLLLLLLASPLYAQTAAPSEEAIERIRAQVQETQERLQLTEAQQEAIRPILEESFEQRLAVLEKHGIDLENRGANERPGFRTMRKLRKDMDKVRKETEKQLDNALTADQMKVWKELEEERRARMREQLENKK